MTKISQIGVIPHHVTLFKFICVLYQFHRQTLPIMKIDRGQIQFQEYVSTGTEPIHKCLLFRQSTRSFRYFCCGASEAKRHLGITLSVVCLYLSVRLSHFWFAYNFFTLRDRTLIFGKCVP